MLSLLQQKTITVTRCRKRSMLSFFAATSDDVLPHLLLLYLLFLFMHRSDYIFYYFSVNFISRELQFFALHFTVSMLPRSFLSFFLNF